MQLKQIVLLCTMIISVWACKDTNSGESDDTDADTADSLANASTAPVEITKIYVWVDKLRMREAPNTKSKIIKELSAADPLVFLNEKSDFTQKITLRGTLFDEPWLKVKTRDDKIGWVYGGGVKFYAPKVDQSPTPYDKCFELLKSGRIAKSESCLMSEQLTQMNKNGKMVSKEAGTLKLRLLSGNHKLLKDITDSDAEYTVYDYYYYYPKMSSFVVRATKANGYVFLLINDKSGREKTIWGFPKIAPDGQHMIITNADLETGNTKNGVQIIGFKNDRLAVLWEKEMTDFRPYAPKWFDSETAEITLRAPAGVDKQPKLAKLRLVDGAWVME